MRKICLHFRRLPRQDRVRRARPVRPHALRVGRRHHPRRRRHGTGIYCVCTIFGIKDGTNSLSDISTKWL